MQSGLPKNNKKNKQKKQTNKRINGWESRIKIAFVILSVEI